MSPLRPLHGGLTLVGHKELTRNAPLIDAALPPRLVFPLFQGGEHELDPIVCVGDRVLKGQAIAVGKDARTPPLHASSSGIVEAIEALPLPHPSLLSGRCIVLATDGLDEAMTRSAERNDEALTPDEWLNRLRQAGIDLPPRAETLILDGTECEPYLTADEALMRHSPDPVIGGAVLLMQSLGAARCLIAVAEDRPDVIATLQNARQREGTERIEIVPVPAIYPIGHESVLVPMLTGPQVTSAGADDVHGTAYQTVDVAAAVFRAVAYGEPLISRIVTVTGRGVRRPGNFSVRIGTPIADLIDQCDGYSHDVEQLALGGSMTGFSLSSDAVPIDKSARCVWVAAAGEWPSRAPPSPCIRCGACADVCPVDLLPQQVYDACRSDDLARAGDYRLADCITCGCCDAVCPSYIPLTQQFRAAQSLIVAQRRQRARADHARQRFEARQARLQREQAERTESARRQKEALKRPGAEEIARAIERAKTRKQTLADPPRPVTLSANNPATTAADPSTETPN